LPGLFLFKSLAASASVRHIHTIFVLVSDTCCTGVVTRSVMW